MAESIQELLQRIAGLSADEADRMSDQIAHDVRAALREEGRCHVRGLGIFARSDSGIRFAPDELFVRAVNVRFSGPDVEAPVATAEGDAVPDHEPESGPAPDGARGAEGDAAAPRSPTAKPAPRLPESRNPRYRRQQQRSGSTSRWLIPLTLIIVLAAAGAYVWFGPMGAELRAERSEPVPSEEPVASESNDPEAPAASAADSLAMDSDSAVAVATQDSSDVPVAAASEPVSDPEAEPDTLSPDEPGYTLIVGSVLNPASAESRIDQFARLKLPTGVLAYDTGGTTRYRLAVGRYDSAAEADSARQALGGELPEGTWVRRIRQ